MTPKRLLVVGGNAGIGFHVARHLADEGWAVTVASRTRGGPEGVEWTGCDARDPDEAAAVVASVEPDALVITVGPYDRQRFAELDLAAWRACFAGNLDTVFNLAQAALPGMRERGWGRIVTFGLAGASRLRGLPMLAGYAAAKAGVLSLTRTLAVIGGPDGVTANCVSPGYIQTEGADPDELARALPRIPAGRLGTPEDAVAVVRFLLTPAAAYVNGAEIPVSGGWGS